MASIESLRSLTLDLPPSCIEFWTPNPEYAVVGTYNLEKTEAEHEPVTATDEYEVAVAKQSQQRNGSLILLQVLENDVKIIQALPTPSAILDVHFAPTTNQSSLFGVATSTGSIELYNLKGVDGKELSGPLQSGVVPKITHVKTFQYFPEDVLITAFSWHPYGPWVGMSLSSGEIHVGFVSGDGSTAKILSHDLEAWTLAFLSTGLGVCSGGDDSALSFRDLPSNIEAIVDGTTEEIYPEERKSLWTDKKIHGAGVTAILPLKSSTTGNLVLTGSYDDHIRLIDAPIIGRRRVLAEMNLGGGVWRLKRLNPPESQDVLLLVSCMHAGARIVNLSQNEDGEWNFEVLGKFEDHKSMNYGSDCQPHLTDNGLRTFVSTSFYDRLLCLWRF